MTCSFNSVSQSDAAEIVLCSLLKYPLFSDTAAEAVLIMAIEEGSAEEIFVFCICSLLTFSFFSDTAAEAVLIVTLEGESAELGMSKLSGGGGVSLETCLPMRVSSKSIWKQGVSERSAVS